MTTPFTIVQVDHFDHYLLNTNLEAALDKLNWRITSKNYKELFIALSDQTIEGIGISWANPNHPTAKYVHFISSKPIPQLIEKLIEKSAPQNKIIFSCWEDEENKIDLITEFNFKLFRKTYMESYTIEFLQQNLQRIQEKKHTYSLKQLLLNPLLEKDLFALLKHNYEQTHLHNEAKNVSWEAWRDMLLSDTPDLNLSSVIVENNIVCAYIFLHQTEKHHYEIGWIGKRNDYNLHALLKKQLTELAALGIKTVEFEVDTTDFFAYEFAKLLNLDNKKSWNSYILNVKK